MMSSIFLEVHFSLGFKFPFSKYFNISSQLFPEIFDSRKMDSNFLGPILNILEFQQPGMIEVMRAVQALF